jgi:tRNA(fMet)-specific endonuclease VapC
MTKEIALDTNILVQYLRNDSGIIRRLEDVSGISIPFFVIGEMMVGFYYTAPPEAARKDFESFLSDVKILECNRSVADKYGEIFAALRRNGTMIPVNDIWIAACCIVADLPLATRDTHFQRVSSLRVEMW